MNTLKKFMAALPLSVFALFATVVHAQESGGDGGTLGSDISDFLIFIDSYLVPLIFAIAFLVFLWGVFRYFIAGGDSDENRKKGKDFIMYGLIGFFVMISVWGIVNILVDSAGFGGDERPALPCWSGDDCSG
jgi:hypothetical protein